MQYLRHAWVRIWRGVSTTSSAPKLLHADADDGAGKNYGQDSEACWQPGGRPPLVEQGAALVVFIVYHLDVLHAKTPHMQHIFDDKRFLVCAAVLGLSCQEAMLRTGSLWPSVCLHWFWVWTWLT